MPGSLFDYANDSGATLILDSTKTTPNLTLANFGTGTGLTVQSVASGIGVDVLTTANSAARFQSAATTAVILQVGRTVPSSPTVASMKFTNASAASAPAFEFTTGSFVSVTSVVLTTAANIKGAVRVKVGDVYYWIPLVLDAGLVGTGAF